MNTKPLSKAKSRAAQTLLFNGLARRFQVNTEPMAANANMLQIVELPTNNSLRKHVKAILAAGKFNRPVPRVLVYNTLLKILLLNVKFPRHGTFIVVLDRSTQSMMVGLFMRLRKHLPGTTKLLRSSDGIENSETITLIHLV